MPAWSNSLFEDNAEYGFGQRIALDKQTEFARELAQKLARATRRRFGGGTLLTAKQDTEAEINAQRDRVSELRQRLQRLSSPEASSLYALADALVKKSVWIMGGDGWAYDIGFGGLDHVIAMNQKVNILVLDTEVYSNTGGQQSEGDAPGRGGPVSPCPAGKRAKAERTWASSPCPTAPLTWRGWLSARRTTKRSKPLRKLNPTPALRSSSLTVLASSMVTRWA